MNKKLVKEYLVLTFILMGLSWGVAVLLCRLFGLDVANPFLRALHILGGFSPTIASYVSLRRCGRVEGLKDWLRKVFDVKHGWATYLAVAVFTAVYFLVGCAFSERGEGAPLFIAPILVAVMLFFGGNEEAGWRMILQPELEKTLGFHGAALSVGAIWWLWHVPLFFIKGTAQEQMNVFLFALMCLSLAWALAAIRRLSDGVFPCVLFHCLINGLSSVFVFDLSLTGCIVTLAINIVLAAALVICLKRRKPERA